MVRESNPQAALFTKLILIVEDDSGIGEYLVEAIRQETSFRALLVTSSQQALTVIRNVIPSLLLLDYHLLSSPLNGIELYDQIHSALGFKRIPAIIMSASFPQALLEQEVKKRGLIAVARPTDLDVLLAALQSQLA
jgi:CheY-like chemotaxis protein